MDPMETFKDETRTCTDCHQPYVWRALDQTFAATNGWLPPKRCPRCRQLRKQSREPVTGSR